MKNNEQVNKQPTDCDITEGSVSRKYKKELEDYVKNNDKHENKVPTDGDATHQFKNDEKHTSEDMTGVIYTQKLEQEKITESKSCHEIRTDCDKIEDTNKRTSH